VGRLTDLFSKRSLDDRLLSGELSPDTGKGKRRAEQLVSERHRAKCAEALRDLVREAQNPRSSLFNANLRIQRALIRDSQALFLTLAREIEELPDVNPRGVILADRLIEDGESPVYITEAAIDENGELVRSVERARAALKAD
jgi:predicted metal-dependent hydrolase